MVCELRVQCGSAVLILVMEALMTSLARAATATAASSQESIVSADRSTEVNNLRRQLMLNNSDYSHELQQAASEEPTPRSRLDAPGRPNKNRSHLITEMSFTEQLVSEERGDKAESQQPISERDLMYYVDDERLVTRPTDHPRYEALKMRRGFRRGGQSQYIRQQDAEGVSIVSLQRAAFPELRLPPSRAQYRRDLGQVVSEELEVPPPPVPSVGEEHMESGASSTAREVEGSQLSTTVM